MFSQFSALLYRLAAAENYRIAATNSDDISATTHWVAQKVEMATLVTLHVMDFTRGDFSQVLDFDAKSGNGAEALDYAQVANLYILAGGNAPDFLGAEEYFGQQVYSVFWHVNLDTGEISVPRGQPKKLFNIREMVARAFGGMHVAHIPANFSEISRPARPVAKHKWPIISIAVIIANAVVLGLMYMAGYNDNVASLVVPVRFGAIVSDFVVYYGQWWRLFTAMFVHFGGAHFFANAFGILIFGTRLERYLGRRMFCAVYLCAGLMGSVFSLAHQYFMQPHVISAGASGAVYGIVGAIFIYTRITKRSIEGIGWYVMLLYIGLGFAMGFATPGIANFAHLGGLLGGMFIGGIYAKFLRN